MVTSLNLTVATFLLAFGEAAVTATIKDPTTNFRARPFTVARIQLAVERAGETFPRPDVVRAEAGDTNFLWCRQRDSDVLVNPCQGLVTFNSVHWSHLACVNFIPFVTGLPSMRVAPDK